MSILAKSNGMHRVSKEKLTEMTELEKQLADKLLQQKNYELEIISTLLHQIGISLPTVAPWREALYKDRQSNRRVGVFLA